MKFPPTSRGLPSLAICLLALLFFPSWVPGQEVGSAVRGAYFRAVAEHFEVPVEEVAILGDWGLTPDEVPVVLFLSGRAGVSPDALISLKKGGRSWMEVAQRFGLGVRSFHAPLPEGVPLGVLQRAYEEFRSRPPGDWDEIDLEDLEVVSLVNLRVLSEQAGVSSLRVLESREEAGSFVAGFASLVGQPPRL